jgi:hypothetical protein
LVISCQQIIDINSAVDNVLSAVIMKRLMLYGTKTAKGELEGL